MRCWGRGSVVGFREKTHSEDVMPQEQVVYGRKFGQRRGYVETDEPYDTKRAQQDLYYIEANPKQVNEILQFTALVKAELECEVAAILENPMRRRHLSPSTVYLYDLFHELRISPRAKWNVYPAFYARLAMEIEYRIECAQRFKVELCPRSTK
jgi:hypothetical protein